MADSVLLSQLYADLNGDHWIDSNNWMSGNPCDANAPWAGVTCNWSYGSVISLELKGNNLKGTLPSYVGSFSELEWGLELSGLSGTIPTQIGRLTKLTALGLGGNDFTGTVPSQLGKLENLLDLSLQHGASGGEKLSGAMPSQMGSLLKLTALQVQQNALSGPIPSEVGRLTNMRVSFNLDNNAFTQHIPSQLGLLKFASQSIDLSYNELSGPIPSEIARLTHLTGDLRMQGNYLQGPLPSQLGRLNQLAGTLDLSQNRIDGFLPTQVCTHEERHSLCLGAFFCILLTFTCSFALPFALPFAFIASFFVCVCVFLASSSLPFFVAQIGMLSELQWGLSLDSNQLSGTLPTELGRLTKLSSQLYLQQNHFRGEIPSQLALIAGMTTLFVFNNDFCNSMPAEIADVGLLNMDVATLEGNRIGVPCPNPTHVPTASMSPTRPSNAPTKAPSPIPSAAPTEAPTQPTFKPSAAPSGTSNPSSTPSKTPSREPSETPTGAPYITRPPTLAPEHSPSPHPTAQPLQYPLPTTLAQGMDSNTAALSANGAQVGGGGHNGAAGAQSASLDGASVAGITVGCFLGVALLALVAFKVMKGSRSKRATECHHFLWRLGVAGPAATGTAGGGPAKKKKRKKKMAPENGWKDSSGKDGDRGSGGAGAGLPTRRGSGGYREEEGTVDGRGSVGGNVDQFMNSLKSEFAGSGSSAAELELASSTPPSAPDDAGVVSSRVDFV